MVGCSRLAAAIQLVLSGGEANAIKFDARLESNFAWDEFLLSRNAIRPSGGNLPHSGGSNSAKSTGLKTPDFFGAEAPEIPGKQRG
jgi:hypothetical protein